MIRDKNINYKYKIDTVEAQNFSSMFNLDSGNGDIELANDNDIHFEQIDTTGLVGLKMTTSTAQLARTLLYSPTHIDWANDVFFRVIWSSDSTDGSDTITWQIKLLKRDEGGFPALGTQALDTVIAADTNQGAACIHYTSWGKLNGGTIAPDLNDFVVVDVELTAFDAVEDKFCVGYQMAYLPKLTDSPQVNDQPAPTDA
tara:strand:+ start:849 stop:1448 length:600 start_codon:yes stop_codon:yes gene_type:complete